MNLRINSPVKAVELVVELAHQQALVVAVMLVTLLIRETPVINVLQVPMPLQEPQAVPRALVELIHLLDLQAQAIVQVK